MKTKQKLALVFLILGLLGTIGILFARLTVDSQPTTIVSEKTINEVNKLSSDNQFVVNSTCYTHTGNLTYAGTKPKPNHTIAIRFNSKIIQEMGLKMWDKVYIQDMGTYFVLDRVPDYQKADIDIYFSSKDDCLKWGRKDLVIEKL